jgi:hypothetical protein
MTPANLPPGRHLPPADLYKGITYADRLIVTQSWYSLHSLLRQWCNLRKQRPRAAGLGDVLELVQAQRNLHAYAIRILRGMEN